MSRPSHLASRRLRALARTVREIGDSLALGAYLAWLILNWIALHIAFGALLLVKFVVLWLRAATHSKDGQSGPRSER